MSEIKGTVAMEETLKGTLNAASGYDGKSAYEIALKNGFEGTEEEWLESLHGKDGTDGQDGYTPIKGVDYFDGKDGENGSSGVYVGSGDMPADCNVQIDPNGDACVVEQTYNPTSTNAQSGRAVSEALKTVNVDLSNYYTKEEIDALVGEMPTSDNWCVIANTTLTENIGSEKAQQKFFEVTTDINGNPLAEKNIRHLRMTFYFPTSEDALYNAFRVKFSQNGAIALGIDCSADRYSACQIDVMNANAMYKEGAPSIHQYSASNFTICGEDIKENANLFGGKAKIEYIAFTTNYPNGTILPVGTKIMITGW